VRNGEIGGDGGPGGGRARRGVVFGEDAGDVALNGAHADEERLGDLAVGATFDEKGEDFPFPFRQDDIHAGDRFSAG
jgi:hypothetical protein